MLARLLTTGSTVAVGLLSMIVLPLPLVRSMGLGGMLIPAVSVLASLTLLPALLAVLGARINGALLVPALMRLLGDANWWTPSWSVSRLPRLTRRRRSPRPAPSAATTSASGSWAGRPM